MARNGIYLYKFQSTLPVGGATVGILSDGIFAQDFNPRSPWGERQKPQGRATGPP